MDSKPNEVVSAISVERLRELFETFAHEMDNRYGSDGGPSLSRTFYEGRAAAYRVAASALSELLESRQSR